MAARHPSKNKLQYPGFVAEQSGQQTAELLEEQPRRKRATVENKDILEVNKVIGQFQQLK